MESVNTKPFVRAGRKADGSETGRNGSIAAQTAEPPEISTKGGAAMAKRLMTLVAMAALFVACQAGTALSAELIVNGGFENEPNYTSYQRESGNFSLLAGSTIPGWTIETDHAVTMHVTGHYPTISGGYSVNMDGEGANGHNANLYQDFATVSGGAYTLAFDWMTWYTGPSATGLKTTVVDTVTGDVLFSENYAIGFASVVVNESAAFLGTGNTLRVRFEESPETGKNDNLFILDNVSVNGSAVPIPGALLLFAPGLAGLAAIKRSLGKEALPAERKGSGPERATRSPGVSKTTLHLSPCRAESGRGILFAQ
jgi:hypothetical protein